MRLTGRVTILGMDDWLVFALDERGRLYQAMLEMDPRWLDAPGPDDSPEAEEYMLDEIRKRPNSVNWEPVPEPSHQDVLRRFGLS